MSNVRCFVSEGFPNMESDGLFALLNATSSNVAIKATISHCANTFTAQCNGFNCIRVIGYIIFVVIGFNPIDIF